MIQVKLRSFSVPSVLSSWTILVAVAFVENTFVTGVFSSFSKSILYLIKYYRNKSKCPAHDGTIQRSDIKKPADFITNQ
jgi:hypothetical protein